VLFQLTRRPYLVNGSLLFLGYSWAFVSRMRRDVPKELIEFHRKEEMDRLKSVARGWMRAVGLPEVRNG
jgi:poly-beta-1,6-N-acetyl-D-glucosamine synthase